MTILAGQRRAGRDAPETGREAVPGRGSHGRQLAPKARKPPGIYGADDAVTNPGICENRDTHGHTFEEVVMPADEPNPRGWPLMRHGTVARIARKTVVAAALSAVAAVTQACGGSGANGTAGLTASSPPPASASATSGSSGPVTYTAKVFMPGMKVTVPTSGWTVYEDHPGEFNLASPPGKMAGTNIHFWLDPYASTPS